MKFNYLFIDPLTTAYYDDLTAKRCAMVARKSAILRVVTGLAQRHPDLQFGLAQPNAKPFEPMQNGNITYLWSLAGMEADKTITVGDDIVCPIPDELYEYPQESYNNRVVVWAARANTGLDLALNLIKELRKIDPLFLLCVFSPGDPHIEVSSLYTFPGILLGVEFPQVELWKKMRKALCVLEPVYNMSMVALEANAMGVPSVRVDDTNVVSTILEWSKSGRPSVIRPESRRSSLMIDTWEEHLCVDTLKNSLESASGTAQALP